MLIKKVSEENEIQNQIEKIKEKVGQCSEYEYWFVQLRIKALFNH